MRVKDSSFDGKRGFLFIFWESEGWMGGWKLEIRIRRWGVIYTNFNLQSSAELLPAFFQLPLLAHLSKSQVQESLPEE